MVWYQPTHLAVKAAQGSVHSYKDPGVKAHLEPRNYGVGRNHFYMS